MLMEQTFSRLHQHYGDQNWWPADNEFEVMVGAILTQNTNWENVSKAIHNLKAHNALDPHTIVDASDEQLAEWIRPSGYFNVKAEYLKVFCRWYLEQGGLDALKERDTDELRAELLKLKGIGPETADDILLYALERPVFVVDEYTRRLFFRLGMINGNEEYDQLRHVIELTMQWDVEVFNEYHALIVKHAKEHCRKTPICEGCPLDDICPDESN